MYDYLPIGHRLWVCPWSSEFQAVREQLPLKPKLLTWSSWESRNRFANEIFRDVIETFYTQSDSSTVAMESKSLWKRGRRKWSFRREPSFRGWWVYISCAKGFVTQGAWGLQMVDWLIESLVNSSLGLVIRNIREVELWWVWRLAAWCKGCRKSHVIKISCAQCWGGGSNHGACQHGWHWAM